MTENQQRKSKPRIRTFSGASRSAYLGATSDGYIGTWGTWPVPINQKVYTDLRVIKTRCREQSLNNDYVKHYLSLMENNIVGSEGVRMQASSKTPKGKLDRFANDAVEKAWKDFSKMRNCDFFGKLSLIDIQMMIIRQIATDGEVFIVKKYGARFKYGMSMQVVDSERVDVQHNAVLDNGHLIVMGIEYDAEGVVVAYHFLQKLRTVHEQYDSTGITYNRVEADDVFHIFKQEFPNQLRGLPLLAGSLYRLKLVEQYENTALIASKLGAANGGHYYRDENSGTYTGDVENGAFVEEITPGEVSILPEGYRYESHDPTYPQTMYGEFLKKAIRGIASGLNISYNMLANDLEGVNFSSIRAAVLEDREHFKVWQRFLIDKFLHLLYEDWLPLALLGGNVKLHTGRPIPAHRVDKLSEINFIPRKWEWVDPLKDARAKIELYDAKASTVSSIIRDAGRDPDEVFEERLKEAEMLKRIVEAESEIHGDATENSDGSDPSKKQQADQKVSGKNSSD